ncbi:MAG: hypothetical protein WDW36_009336 [Sanguina aurantia]
MHARHHAKDYFLPPSINRFCHEEEYAADDGEDDVEAPAAVPLASLTAPSNTNPTSSSGGTSTCTPPSLNSQTTIADTPFAAAVTQPPPSLTTSSPCARPPRAHLSATATAILNATATAIVSAAAPAPVPPPASTLISPCLCCGSVKYVHIGCLQSWRGYAPEHASRCNVCHFEYRVEQLDGRPIFLRSKGSMMLFLLAVMFSAAVTLGFIPVIGPVDGDVQVLLYNGAMVLGALGVALICVEAMMRHSMVSPVMSPFWRGVRIGAHYLIWIIMLANWESAILPRAFPFLPSPPVGIQLVYAIFGICILFGRSLYSLSAWAEKRRLLGEVVQQLTDPERDSLLAAQRLQQQEAAAALLTPPPPPPRHPTPPPQTPPSPSSHHRLHHHQRRQQQVLALLLRQRPRQQQQQQQQRRRHPPAVHVTHCPAPQGMS